MISARLVSLGIASPTQSLRKLIGRAGTTTHSREERPLRMYGRPFACQGQGDAAGQPRPNGPLYEATTPGGVRFQYHSNRKGSSMSLATILIIILIIILLGGFSGVGGGPFYGGGPQLGGVLGIILVILLVLMLVGRI